ncbi:MAG: hypothetical protein QM765_34855 [Myxococcales bacterium]
MGWPSSSATSFDSPKVPAMRPATSRTSTSGSCVLRTKPVAPHSVTSRRASASPRAENSTIGQASPCAVRTISITERVLAAGRASSTSTRSKPSLRKSAGSSAGEAWATTS